jgi:hypothetical protein
MFIPISKLKELAVHPEFVELAATVIAKMAYSQVMREKVDAYIRPVFDRFTFTVVERFQKTRGERITRPEDLYLSDDDALCKEFYLACHEAHRENGHVMKEVGDCPALIAEWELCQAEYALLVYAGKAFEAPLEELGLESRKKCVDLLVGLAVKADTDRKGRI